MVGSIWALELLSDQDVFYFKLPNTAKVLGVHTSDRVPYLSVLVFEGWEDSTKVYFYAVKPHMETVFPDDREWSYVGATDTEDRLDRIYYFTDRKFVFGGG